MPWKEKTVEELAISLGLDASVIREKQKLIDLIKKARKEKNLSQLQLAKKMGLTQSRIAQIESKIGTTKVTFEILLSTLNALDYSYKIVAKKIAA